MDYVTETVRFAPGSEVRIVRNIRNDGSFQSCEKGDLLVEAGAVGIVRTYGYFLQTQIIYQVFVPEQNRVIGVRGSEVMDATLDWIPCNFRSLDKAKLTCNLRMFGEPLASKDDVVEVHRVYRDLEDGSLTYEVKFGEHIVKLDSARLATLT